MTVRFRDTFTDADGTLLTAHTPDVGTGYTRISGSSGAAVMQITNENRAREDKSGGQYADVLYRMDFSGGMPSEWALRHTVRLKSAIDDGGAGVRIDFSSGAYIRFWYDRANNNFALAPSWDTGAASSWSPSVGVEYEWAIASRLNSGVREFGMFLDGAQVGSWLAITNPSNYSTVTAFQLYSVIAPVSSNSVGYHYDVATLDDDPTEIVEATPSPSLLITTEPSTTASGYVMSPSPVCSMTTDGTTVDTGFTGNISVAIFGAGGVLLGTLTVAAVLGVATFSALRPCIAGTYTLRFSASGVSDLDSDPFTVTSGSGGGVIINGAGMQRPLKDGETTAERRTIALDVRDSAGAHVNANGEAARIKIGSGAWDDAENTVVGTSDGNELTLSTTEAAAGASGQLIQVYVPASVDHLKSPIAAFEIFPDEPYAAAETKETIAAAVRDDQIDMLLEGIAFPSGSGDMTVKKSDGTTVTISVTRGSVSGGILGTT